MHWGAFATYLLAAQKSMFLLHGCQQCLLTRVLRWAIISCFTNYRSTMFVQNSRSGGEHHSLLSLGTGTFTHFHLHKRWMPRSSPNGGGKREFQMTGALLWSDNNHGGTYKRMDEVRMRENQCISRHLSGKHLICLWINDMTYTITVLKLTEKQLNNC